MNVYFVNICTTNSSEIKYFYSLESANDYCSKYMRESNLNLIHKGGNWKMTEITFASCDTISRKQWFYEIPTVPGGISLSIAYVYISIDKIKLEDSNIIQEEIDKLKCENNKLKKENEEMRYFPGGPGYTEALNDWKSHLE